MPFGDSSGPMGQGPMTGRGAGYCAGYNRPGYANPVPRFGRGRGWRNWYRAYGYAPAYPPVQPTIKEEKEMIRGEMNALKEQMKSLEDRLEELKKKK